MVAQEYSTEPQELDLDNIPRIDTGQESEWNDGDTSVESAVTENYENESRTDNNEPISEKANIPKQITPTHAGTRTRRLTRGVSLLPIRQPSPAAMRQRHILSGSPPTASALQDALGTSPTHAYSSPLASSVEHTPASNNQTPINIYANRPNLSSTAGTSPVSNAKSNISGSINSPNSSIHNPCNGNSSNNSNSSQNYEKLTNESKLSECMTHLAIKESHVGDLRLMLSSLQQELREAEADLAKYKNNVKLLAEMVHSQPSDIMRQSRDHNLTESGSAEKDVLGISRRVVDGIGSQFWSFLDDVRSATMGNLDFDGEQSDQAGSRGRDTTRKDSQVVDSQPSPRRLSPKKSIQNFIKSRPTSPIRMPMSPGARQQAKREQAELRASQRLRESQRLNTKLSQLDLRSPSPVRSNEQ